MAKSSPALVPGIWRKLALRLIWANALTWVGGLLIGIAIGMQL